ncbi:MAG: hypothetical protein A3B90_01810 [Candidatus Magasanikbacteria bacterium RIFCSPHIGHO2_02_FULL_41_13]|uniref:Dipeptidylpeptidase IV N-terminal domain-containing protein n=1 Tax=Candidatus Magasanikbacteria bacterium RIFCSPHIGHO2_02_FULL_41_13 TaxID=1798676 RepID=A0A1F6M5N7_9BACT|nr:MAG: hypothetical protein A3B90_01810 [Candidatus Magasanikbacteria bacterium RIFCSPHIGHO2_02_FULL_41_13]
MDKKRILIALGFLVLCIGLGYLIYRFFFAPVPVTPSLPGQKVSTSTIGTFPEAGIGGQKGSTSTQPSTLPTAVTLPGAEAAQGKEKPVTQLVSDAIIGVQSSKGGMRYYNQQDGKFYRIDQNGKPIPLDDKTFFDVSKVTWAPGKDESILEYPDGSNTYYNFETKKQVTLPKHWQEFSFAPNSDKVAAKSIAISSDGSWLISSSPDGQNVKLVEALGANADKVDVNWSPNQQVIATSRTGDPLGADQQQILLIGQNHENYKSLTVEGRGMVSEWSPSGGKLLYSVYSKRSDYKPELWISNAAPGTAGTERKLLNVNTWADKCTFTDDRYVYCGIPTTLATGAGFVPALADQTPDIIYKIDTQTGVKTELPIEGTHVVGSMFVGDDGQSIYFTDKNQNGLFRVNP